MLKKEKNIWKIYAAVVISVIFCLGHNTCTAYNPSLYPSYDVLNPGPEVAANPIAYINAGKVEDRDHNEIHIVDGYVVNEAFMMWAYELKEEVKKLRGN